MLHDFRIITIILIIISYHQNHHINTKFIKVLSKNSRNIFKGKNELHVGSKTVPTKIFQFKTEGAS